MSQINVLTRLSQAAQATAATELSSARVSANDLERTEGRRTDRVPVVMVKPWRRWYPGNVCGFSPELAIKLIEAGIAKAAGDVTKAVAESVAPAAPPPPPPPPPAPESVPAANNDLDDMHWRSAVAEIEKETDVSRLQGWAETERRPAVVSALETRIETLSSEE